MFSSASSFCSHCNQNFRSYIYYINHLPSSHRKSYQEFDLRCVLVAWYSYDCNLFRSSELSGFCCLFDFKANTRFVKWIGCHWIVIPSVQWKLLYFLYWYLPLEILPPHSQFTIWDYQGAFFLEMSVEVFLLDLIK